ncbi:Putative transcriptional regulator of 2-aminoethylphosphonate degradation operons [Escherichia coli]|uniref:Transcriptional regulator of 2-aminoethylphosphonate degradation operons n=1 Tax=Escherichia coli TaxID=562 RepID=A0A3P5DWW7_ECOLX|nr:Putative transcriptional regulator of 2-aminoethylphosphonate degradation operons [Escherichia coli]
MHRNLPIYLQIREALRNGIAQNVYKQGERLPSENELAAQFNTTRATVVHAMQGLLTDGLIERIRDVEPSLKTFHYHRNGYANSWVFWKRSGWCRQTPRISTRRIHTCLNVRTLTDKTDVIRQREHPSAVKVALDKSAANCIRNSLYAFNSCPANR